MSIDNSVQLDGGDEGAERVARSILDSIVDTIVTGVCRNHLIYFYMGIRVFVI